MGVTRSPPRVTPNRSHEGAPMNRLSAVPALLALTLSPLLARAQSADEALAALASAISTRSATAWSNWRSPAIRAPSRSFPPCRMASCMSRADHVLFIKQDDGSFVDAATGKPAPDVMASGVKQVRMNNPVRGAVDAALGSLRLFATDPAMRLEAAEAVFHSHDPAALPALDKAIAQGNRCRASSAHGTGPRRRTPVLGQRQGCRQARRDRRDPCARRSRQPRAAGRPCRTSRRPWQKRRPRPSPRSIVMLQLWSILQSIYYGLSLGSVLLLAAAGLAITFGVMGVINMAHGEMVMLGAYVTFVVQQTLHTHRTRSVRRVSLLIAVPLAFIVAGMVGIIIERTLIRWLYGRPLETLLATWGLSLVLQQAVRSIFGADNRDVSTPDWMSGATQLGGLTITYNRLYIIVFAALVLMALMAALRYTPLGLQMRAVTQNRRMAAAMGIRTPWIDALTFGLGSGVAGMAGVALSQIDNVSPNLGQGYIIDSFMVVVFGGVGNLWGTRGWRLDAGRRQQVPRTVRRRGARQDRRAGAADPVHPATSARHVPAQGQSGGGVIAARTTWATLVLVLGGAALLAVLNLTTPATSELHVTTYVIVACRQISLLRDAGVGGGPGMGLRRHPVAGPCGVLRARRLRDGDVPDALHRRARRLWQCEPAGLHGVPGLA